MSETRDAQDAAGADDLALVRAARCGHRAELVRLAERLRCVPRMLLYLDQKHGRLLGRDELADLGQDVVVRVWSKLSEFEAVSSLEAWVHGFCLREYWNAVRRAHRRRHEARVAARHGRDASEGAPGAEPHAYEELYAGLRKIGRDEARVIELKHFEGRTFEEIGARLGIPTNTAKTRYYRGLCELRSVLGARGDVR
jgi:RNA polymerase sigma-70 factor (ECF subfamily)